MASLESLELARAWMEKAAHDLETARLLIHREKRLLDIAVYHCQQAAEKALKGWLTAREILFPKTHSLVALIDLCSSAAAEFAKFHEQAVELTPLGIAYRYPGDASVPDIALASRAFGLAEEIYNFCEQQLADT
jgi:HEPN domain-containing protein